MSWPQDRRELIVVAAIWGMLLIVQLVVLLKLASSAQVAVGETAHILELQREELNAGDAVRAKLAAETGAQRALAEVRRAVANQTKLPAECRGVIGQTELLGWTAYFRVRTGSPAPGRIEFQARGVLRREPEYESTGAAFLVSMAAEVAEDGTITVLRKSGWPLSDLGE